jgi:hypothetical protein
MYGKLEDILIKMNNDIMMIEDDAKDELSRLETKMVYIVGIFNQLDLEFSTLEIEYKNATTGFFREEEDLQVFEDSKAVFEKLMADITKH